MKKIFIVVALCFVIVGGIALQQKQSHKTRVGQAFHKTFYEEANAEWDAHLTLTSINKKTLGATTVESSSSLGLSWEKPKQTYNHFLVTVTDPATQWTRTESGEHERVTLELFELRPDRAYVVALRACVNPTCKTWFVSQTEVRAKTFPEYWKIASATSTFEHLESTQVHQESLRDPRTKKHEAETEREGWQTSVLKHNIHWMWENNTDLSAQDVDRLVIDRVVIEGDISRQRLDFHADQKTGYATLMNP